MTVVEVVDGEDPKVGENEENVAKPEQNVEQSQAPIEPESIICQAAI